MDDKQNFANDIPSEANRGKHLNFLEAEEKTSAENIAESDRFGRTKEDQKRRRQWQEGLEEGRRTAKNED